LKEATERPAVTTEEVGAALASVREAATEKIDVIGRQMGAAIGRVRVQVESIAQQTASVAALKDELERVAAKTDERVAALAASVHDLFTAMSADIAAERDAVRRQGAGLAAELAAMRAETTSVVAGLSNAIKALPELEEMRSAMPAPPTAEQIAAAVPAPPTPEQIAAAVPSIEQIAAELERHRETIDRRAEAQSQQVASIAARVKAALETLGTQITSIAQRVEAVSAVDDVARSIHADVAGLPETINRHVGSSVSAATGALSQTLSGVGERIGGLAESLAVINARLDALPGPDDLAAAMRDEREAADRRSEGMGQQVAAVVGTVITSLAELRSSVDALGERPDVPPELRDEIVHLTNAAAASVDSSVDALRVTLTESIAALRAAVNESTDAARARVEEDAASIRTYFFEGATALRAHIDETATSIRKALDDMTQRLAQESFVGDEVAKLSGLEERVAGILRDEQQSRDDRSRDANEQLKTVSASVGAIYLRVRSLEQSVAELKGSANRDAEVSKAQLGALDERLAELAALERRVSEQIGSLEGIVRERAAERERDHEIMAILAELADATGKDRARLGERLRGFIDRSRPPPEPDVPEPPAPPRKRKGDAKTEKEPS
jgi:chromosome segregation ATPase